MLKKIILAAAICLPLQAAATENCDTLLRASGAALAIVETDSCLEVVVNDAAGRHVITEPYPEQGTVSSRQSTMRMSSRLWSNDRLGFDLVSGYPLIGFSCAKGAPAGTFDMARSIEISWLQVLGVSMNMHKSRCMLRAGLGISWRNYRTVPNMMLTADESGAVDFAPIDEDVTPRSSRIKVFSLTLPVLFAHDVRLGRSLEFTYSFGPVLNFNPHASLRTRWFDAQGQRQYESTSHIAHRKFTADIFAAAGLNGLMVYVRYSPMSVLTRGLDFSSLSAGIVVAL